MILKSNRTGTRLSLLMICDGRNRRTHHIHRGYSPGLMSAFLRDWHGWMDLKTPGEGWFYL